MARSINPNVDAIGTQRKSLHLADKAGPQKGEKFIFHISLEQTQIRNPKVILLLKLKKKKKRRGREETLGIKKIEKFA